jgi:fructose-bisphosphate aldolase class 1
MYLLAAATTAVALLASGAEARQTVVAEVADAVLWAYQLHDGLLLVGIMAAGGGTRREAATRPGNRLAMVRSPPLPLPPLSSRSSLLAMPVPGDCGCP